MRKFAIIVFDNNDDIVDRFNLDHVSDISGIGFELNISKIETDIEDFVTKVVQKKTTMSLKIWHSRLENYNSLKNFISLNINNSMALEYYDGNSTMYAMGKVSKSENDNGEYNVYHYIENTITFTPTTPFFLVVKNEVRIAYSSTGKNYPFYYSYAYGQNRIENNSIANTYIKDIPLIITITGSFANNPTITLADEDGEIYNQVSFLNLTLSAGDTLVINAATKKILFKASGSSVWQDYYSYLDPTHDSFLRAKALTTSSIDANLSAGDSGSVIGSRRQYIL